MNKHKSNKIKENSNTVRHLIMGQITTTQNLVAIKEVRHAGQWLFAKRTNPSLLCRVVQGCRIYWGFYVCGTGWKLIVLKWFCYHNADIFWYVDVNLAISTVILQFHYHVDSLYLPDTPRCISDVSAYQFLRQTAPGGTECWKRHLAGEIGSAGVRLVSWDHGLFHDRRRALILINPDILLIGPLETKPPPPKKKKKKKKTQKK